MEFQAIIKGVFTAFLLFPIAFSTHDSSYPNYLSSLLLQAETSFPYITSSVKEISGRSFDYIIVGGGASGCPLAATLSEKFTVLLIERGGSPYGDPLIEQKKKFGFSMIEADEFKSSVQSFVSEEGVPNYRGRVLGGSTAINGGFYSRASGDFIKGVGWDEKMVREAYEWVESRMVFEPEQLSLWQSGFRDALIEAGVLPFKGFSLEHIEGSKIGGSIFDDQGRRHSAADLLGAGDGKRITVLVNATVRDVMFHDKGGGARRPRAQGVRFMNSHGSTEELYEAYLKQPQESRFWGDVILSAGALGSPQILLLSGIGPLKHLQSLNISPLIESSEVGIGIQDNPSIPILIPSSIPNHPDPPQVVAITNDYKIITQSLIIPLSSNLTIRALVAKIANPVSRGVLELKNTDPRQNPKVVFNYLSNHEDLKECVEMCLVIDRVSGTKSFDTKSKELSNREAIEDYCKKNVRTYYHYHGGCNVGSVVDSDYRVFGVDGLRIVDGSTLIDSPGTNPMATLLMLGKYQGVKMVRERGDVLVDCR